MCSVKEKDTETFPHELTLIFQRLWGFHFFQPSFQLLFYCSALLKRNSAWYHHLPYLPFFSLDDPFFFSQPSCLIQNSVSNIKRNLTLVTVKRLQVKGGVIIFAVVFLEYSIVSFPMTALFFLNFLFIESVEIFAAYEFSLLRNRSLCLRVTECLSSQTCVHLIKLSDANIEPIYLTWAIVTSKYIHITFISSITSNPLQFW